MEQEMTVEAALVDLTSAVRGLSVKFDGLSERVDGLSERVDGLTQANRDTWQALGVMNRRLDSFESLLIKQRDEFAELKHFVRGGFGALKESIEQRDFRLDEHGRRLNELEKPRS